jgi:predicted ester cyclase
MDSSAHVAVVTRFYEQGVNQRRWDIVDTLLAPEFRHNGQVLGVAGQRRNLETLYAAFPDLRVEIEETVAQGDRVVTRMTWTGIQQGEFMGVRARGKRVQWAAISIIRLAGGKLAEAHVIEDGLGLLRQMQHG